jgi:hypothetical protein
LSCDLKVCDVESVTCCGVGRDLMPVDDGRGRRRARDTCSGISVGEADGDLLGRRVGG